MYRLNAVQQMATRLMGEVFTIQGHEMSGNSLGYTFHFDNARQRLGCCSYSNKTISLSKYLCLENLDKVDGKLTDTMLHELAHAFAREIHGRGCSHDYRWVRIAQAIGCDGERCYSSEDVNAVTNSKYTNTCPACGNTTPSHKRRRRSYACTPCCNKAGGGYRAEFKLIVTQNY